MSAILIESNKLKVEIFNDLLAKYIENLNIVNTGTEALQLFTTRSFQYVFLDHQLPDCLGSELLRNLLKQHPQTRFISTSNDVDIIAGYRRLGYDDLLQPPFHDNVQRIFENKSLK